MKQDYKKYLLRKINKLAELHNFIHLEIYPVDIYMDKKPRLALNVPLEMLPYSESSSDNRNIPLSFCLLYLIYEE